MTNVGIKPDMNKVKIIQKWKRSLIKKKPRLLFGLANCYYQFIQKNSKVIKTLSNLLKNDYFKSKMNIVIKLL